MSKILQSQKALIELLKPLKEAKEVKAYSAKLTQEQLNKRAFRSPSLQVSVEQLTRPPQQENQQAVRYTVYALSNGAQAESNALELLEQIEPMIANHQGEPFIKKPKNFKQQRVVSQADVVAWSLSFEWIVQVRIDPQANSRIMRYSTQILPGV